MSEAFYLEALFAICLLYNAFPVYPIEALSIDTLSMLQGGDASCFLLQAITIEHAPAIARSFDSHFAHSPGSLASSDLQPVSRVVPC